MRYATIKSIAVSAVLVLSGCEVFKTSLTPAEVYNMLPTMTKSKLLKSEDINQMECTCLTKNRNYTAPMGLTVNEDLRNGAKGIDEWVQLDGGNAYVLKNYKWMTVGYNPKNSSTATQLYIEFDTFRCR